MMKFLRDREIIKSEAVIIGVLLMTFTFSCFLIIYNPPYRSLSPTKHWSDPDPFPQFAHSYPIINHRKNAIAIILFSCRRVNISRVIDQLIKYRPSRDRFPILVFQDCWHGSTINTILSYRKMLYLVYQPNQTDILLPRRKQFLQGYYRISRNYKWALDLVFNYYNFSAAVVVEDDLDISPDFYEYFMATLPILQTDPTLWCVSAYNDNVSPGHANVDAVNILYRSDFFSGLGWMLTNTLWQELMVKWPDAYWDDWMRMPEQRKGRHCIRPEVSRTITYGKTGVSQGQDFNSYLRFVHLNEKYVEFTQKNLSYLRKEEYDRQFFKAVRSSCLVSFQELEDGKVFCKGPIRIQYKDKKTLKEILHSIGLVEDFKSGVPRTAYNGVIPFVYGRRRVYLAPWSKFKGYESD